MTYKLKILKEGYSRTDNDYMYANSTSTLVTGNKLNIIVDTLSAWDKEYLIQSLHDCELTCNDINYVICTHGHCDHVGNLNLFTNATHIVGWNIHKADKYTLHSFENGDKFEIAKGLEVIPTPGHTHSDVSLIIHDTPLGVVAITGDLFERESDIENYELWKVTAGSENPEIQYKNRQIILDMVKYIIPGHGPGFNVTNELKEKHRALRLY